MTMPQTLPWEGSCFVPPLGPGPVVELPAPRSSPRPCKKELRAPPRGCAPCLSLLDAAEGTGQAVAPFLTGQVLVEQCRGRATPAEGSSGQGQVRTGASRVWRGLGVPGQARRVLLRSGLGKERTGSARASEAAQGSRHPWAQSASGRAHVSHAQSVPSLVSSCVASPSPTPAEWGPSQPLSTT